MVDETMRSKEAPSGPGRKSLPPIRKMPPRLLSRSLPRASSFRKPKPDRKAPKRGVSFCESGPVIERVDSVRNLLCEPDDTEEEVKKTMNELWYDDHEIETGKHESAQLVLECEAGGTAPQEGEEGMTLRGLERQTEEGGWEQFQNRNNVLGAVLDEPQEDADRLAERASEATEDARKKAHERAQQDELEAQEYLADIKEYLSKTMHVLPTQDIADEEDSDPEENPADAPKNKRGQLRRVKTENMNSRPDFDWKASARKIKAGAEEDADGDGPVDKDDTIPKEDNANSLLSTLRKNWKENNRPASALDDGAAAAIQTIKRNKLKKKRELKRSKSMNAKTLMSADIMAEMDASAKEAP